MKESIVTQTKAGRIEYIDMFRSFGIILMIMGHVGFGDSFDQFIHAFHMPMFFFVSGFLFRNKKERFSAYMVKKCKTLILPYIIFGLFHYVVYSLMNNSFSFEPIKALLLFPTNGLPIAGALWFLIALFVADIVYYWIERIKDQRIQCIIVISVALMGQYLPRFFEMSIPFALSPALVGVGLIHIGRKLRKYEEVVVGLTWYQILFFGVLISASIIKSNYINMRTGNYSADYLMFWVNAVGASVIGLNISRSVKTFFKNCVVSNYLQSVGRNSIVYVCFNQIVIMLSADLIYPYMGNSYLIKALLLCITLIMLFTISFVFEHTKLKVILGRF